MKTYLHNVPPIIREFLGYTETIKGKSPKTVEGYYIDLRTFFRFIKKSRGLVSAALPFEEINIDDVNLELVKTITLTDVYEFLSYIKSERANEAATRSRKVSSIRSFFNYLTSKAGKLEENPVLELEPPKLKKRLPKYLTLEQSLELLQSVDGQYKERDFLILTLFLNCGLRLSELCSLNVSDIRDDGTLRVTGKGNKERTIYLNDSCKTAIKEYLAKRPVDGVKDKNALFLSARKSRITGRGVQYIIDGYLDKIGLSNQGYSPHKLRHTAATLMYQHGGVDVRVLKDILGHENLNTTQIYTHVSDTQMEKAVRANPLSKVKRTKKQETDADIS